VLLGRVTNEGMASYWPTQAAKLKQQPGKDLAVLGSPNLTVSLLGMGLVDELRVMVNPVALGDGKSLFRSSKQELGLKLLQTRTFRSGNVLLTYRPPRRAR
jgi:dihydrofolate reductase